MCFFRYVFFHDDVGNGGRSNRKFLQSLQILWIRSGDFFITCGLCEPLTTESRQGPMFHMNLYQIHFYGRYGAILLVGCPCGMIFSWAEFLGGLEGMILQTSDWKIPNHLHPWKFNMSPENQWLEDVFPTILVVPFWVHVSFQGWKWKSPCNQSSFLGIPNKTQKDLVADKILPIGSRFFGYGNHGSNISTEHTNISPEPNPRYVWWFSFAFPWFQGGSHVILFPGGGISNSLSRRVFFVGLVGTLKKGEELRECRDAVKELGRLQDEVWSQNAKKRKDEAPGLSEMEKGSRGKPGKHEMMHFWGVKQCNCQFWRLSTWIYRY